MIIFSYHGIIVFSCLSGSTHLALEVAQLQTPLREPFFPLPYKISKIVTIPRFVFSLSMGVLIVPVHGRGNCTLTFVNSFHLKAATPNLEDHASQLPKIKKIILLRVNHEFFKTYYTSSIGINSILFSTNGFIALQIWSVKSWVSFRILLWKWLTGSFSYFIIAFWSPFEISGKSDIMSRTVIVR